MSNSYDPNSINAVLSRIETNVKDLSGNLKDFVETQKAKEIQQDNIIAKLWGKVGRIEIKVAGLAAVISGAMIIINHFWK